MRKRGSDSNREKKNAMQGKENKLMNAIGKTVKTLDFDTITTMAMGGNRKVRRAKK